MAAAFSVPPWQVAEQDELEVADVMTAMFAKQAVDDFNAKARLSPAQGRLFQRLLDEADAYDEAMGVPEEE